MTRRVVLPLAFFFLVWGFLSSNAEAQFNFSTEGEAYTKCLQAAAHQNADPGVIQAGHSYLCDHQGTGIRCKRSGATTNCWFDPWGNTGTWSWYTWDTGGECSALPEQNIFTGPGNPQTACSGGCGFTQDGANGVGVCTSEACLSPMVPDGNVCDPTVNPEEQAPAGCTVDGITIVCDCNANPGAPFCPGGSANNDCSDNGDGTVSCSAGGGGTDPGDQGGSNPPGGGQDPDGGNDTTPPGATVGGNENKGDGDPDTPGDGPGGGPDDSTGTGPGDTDGDGERDVDCDPSSNPDCQYTGSGTSSSNCSTPPQCTGDPVQCTILRQQWHNMCYLLKDSGQGLDPWPDIGQADFDALGTHSEEIEVDGALDRTGFLGGGSCPTFDAAAIPGMSAFQIDSQPFCDFATWAGYLVLAFAGLVSARIIAGGM